MKTEFQVRPPKVGVDVVPMDWTTDINFLRENCQTTGNTLWCRKSETPEEAAMRRMAALDKADAWQAGSNTPLRKPFEPPSAFADRLSPPPPTTECRVDWQTLEPIKEVPVWQLPDSLTWIAGVDASQWSSEGISPSFHRLVQGRAAIGPTRETALRNFEELQNKRT